MNKTEFWLMNNPVRRAAMRFEASKLKRMSGAAKFVHVLELGCGEGQGTKNILRLFNPKSVYAIDLDSRMIERAKRRVKDTRVTFAQDDAAKLRFAKNQTYDAVFDFGIIHHIPNWQECLREVYRVLKPGGLFLLEDLSIETFTKKPLGRLLRKTLDHPYDSMYTKQEFEQALAKVGFTVVRQSQLRPYVFWKVLTTSSQRPRK